MKLASIEVPTPDGPVQRIGAVVGDRVVDLTAAYAARLREEGLSRDAARRIAHALVPTDMKAFIEGGARSLAAAQEAIAFVQDAGDRSFDGIRPVHALASVRLLPPVRPPLLRDFMAFEEHVQGSLRALGRGQVPEAWYAMPVYYKGNPLSLVGHDAEIQWPAYTERLDYELELAIVFGREGTDIPEEEASTYIFGYTILNDFSARDIQAKEMSVGLGPAKGKDFRTGTALGPWIVTADEIPDPYNLRMVARVNGETWSEGYSSTIHWRFEQMIAHASRSETLYPGEVMGSGTVGGGCGLELGRWLRPGDVVELEIEGIGVLRNRVVR